MKELKPGAGRSLMLSTTTFAISFATWCSIAALAPTFTHAYNLSAKASGLLIALPVLVGAVGEDSRRNACRPVRRTKSFFGADDSFSNCGCRRRSLQKPWSAARVECISGSAGTSFAIGVSSTSRWFTNDQQGTALGLFGIGNIGQSIAMFGAPVIALWLGSRRPVFFILALISAIWGWHFICFRSRRRFNSYIKNSQ